MAIDDVQVTAEEIFDGLHKDIGEKEIMECGADEHLADEKGED